MPGQTLSAQTEEAPVAWRNLLTFCTRTQVPILVAATFIATATGGVIPIFSYLLGRTFDDFAKLGGGATTVDDFKRQVKANITFILILGAGAAVLNALFFAAWSLHGEMRMQVGGSLVFDSVTTNSATWYHMQIRSIGAILQSAQKQMRELQTAMSLPFGHLIQSCVTCLAALGVALWSSWDLTLVTLSTLPLCIIVIGYTSKKIEVAIRRQTEVLTLATQLAKNAMGQIETVKSCSAQVEEAVKYLRAIEAASFHYLTQAWWTACQICFVRLITRTLFVQGFWYGNHLVHHGTRSSGQILTGFWACLMAAQTFDYILPQIKMLVKAGVAGGNLQELLRAETLVFDEETGDKPMHCEGCVRLTDVTFAYPTRPDCPSLKKISLAFQSGKTTFVVGRSGSGKSTIAALLLRFYAIREGQITLDGHSIESLSLEWLRQNIAVVTQDDTLFNETVLKNIGFGRGNADPLTHNLLVQGIRVAALSNVIESLPEGLSTVVGTTATGLSGGQAQRVSIARARIKDSPLLILDEATSALDRTTATTVMRNILQWRKGKTTVVITHDIAQVSHEGFVYVLDEGSVVQHGYRKDLENNHAPTPFMSLARAAGVTVSKPGMDAIQRGGANREYLSNKPLPVPEATPQLTPRTLSSKKSFAQSELSDGDASGFSVPIIRRPSVFFTTPVLGLTQARPMTQLRDSSSIPLLLDSVLPATGTSEPQGQSKSITSAAGSAARERRNRGTRSPVGLSSPRLSNPGAEDIEMVGLSSTGALPDEDEFFDGRPVTRRTRKAATEEMLSTMKILRTVWWRVGCKFQIYCCLGFAAAIIHAACTPLFSWVFSRLLQTYFVPNGTAEIALRLSLALLGIGIADGVSNLFMHYLLECSAQAWADDIRFEALRRVLDQPKAWFEGNEAGVLQIPEFLDRGAEEMKGIVGRFAGSVFTAAAMALIGLIWCLVISWKMTLVIISTGPVLFVLTMLYQKINVHWETKINRDYQAVFDVLSETCGKILTVRAFCLQQYFSKTHSRASRRAFKTGVERAVATMVFFGLAESSIFFVVALAFWYGSKLVAAGDIEVGHVMTVLAMLLFVISGVIHFVGSLPHLSSARATATSLMRLVELRSWESDEHMGDTRIATPPGSVWFRNVKFRYPSRPDHAALDGVTFEIPMHSSTALVGLSGSGKSTIISLLLRIHTLSGGMSSGSLKVGDIPLSQLDTGCWRGMVAYVPQQPTIFPGTIQQNISYGLPWDSPFREVSMVRNAARHVGLHDFILSLPKGYDTVVGEGGIGLSGGQRQKVAIARALIRRPKLLLLDEPTSALDATSAKQIRSLLENLVEADALTVFVVTHSTEMMKVAKRVVVLKKGVVVEQGNFESLIDTNGHLRALVGGGATDARGR